MKITGTGGESPTQLLGAQFFWKLTERWMTKMKSKLLTRIMLVSLLALTLIGASAFAFPVNSPVGFATYPSLGMSGITGGGNGETVVVTNIADLQKHASSPEPLTIFVKGTITGSRDVHVESNKTIIGLGDDATLKWFGLRADGAHNIIIRNLTITDVRTDDAIALRDCHHVWIDHCDLHKAKDGLLDFTLGSDFITVSWTIFREHDKVSLINSGTNHWEDHNKNRNTYYYNWFKDNVQRNPRVGYGLGHVFNNYYTNITSYAIGTHTRAKVLAENNYFFNTNNPFQQMYNHNDWEANYGDLESVGNIFENSRGNTTGTGKSFDPSFYYDYDFILSDAAAIPNLVSTYAGPGAAFEHLVIPVPGNGTVDLAVNEPELTWVDTREVESWNVYFGTNTTLNRKANVTEPVFNPGKLQPNTVYFWRVDAVTADGEIKGELWRFRTAPALASKPQPANGSQPMPYDQADAVSAKPLELDWAAGLGAVAHDVYLGTTPELDENNLLGRVEESSFAPGRLQLGETYYWRVDTVLADGTIVPGETWSFELPVLYIGAGRTEAEDMVIGGRYFKEHHPASPGAYLVPSNYWLVKVEAGTGTLSAVWNDPDTVCDLTIAYLDQSSGRGVITVYVNDEQVDRIVATKNTNQIETHTIENVELKTGDEIRIVGSSDQSMLTRIDYIEIAVK